MTKGKIILLIVLVFIVLIVLFTGRDLMVKTDETLPKTITLPVPKYEGQISLEQAIKERRSIRSFKNKPLTLEIVSQLLWAAQGVTNEEGLRASPSAGATYPMEIYIVVGNVNGLDAGVYKYDCSTHALLLVNGGDKRVELSDATLGQPSVRMGQIDIVICGVYERTDAKYGARAERYVHMEAGHVAQNIYLQSVVLGLGTVTVGAINDEEVQLVVGNKLGEHPMYVMPIGFK
jgi:SagB-type dehydrogenase family enzyme